MRRTTLAAAALLPFLALGCGPSQEEWQAQLAKYTQVVNENSARAKELELARARVAELEAELNRMGVETSKLSLSLSDREHALAEYKARAHQLELLKARFDLLRHKLDELTHLGLVVTIRRNRMVIPLPGDVLFDTGKDTLKPEGRDILGKVAAVIHNDESLLGRDYQVGGHTDNQPLAGGLFHDNWGLSLMRSRAVLVHLIGKGALPAKHWSAAGFGETDPLASNDTRDGQQKNRRCELIVVPDADEMLDLKNLAETGKAR